MYKTIERPDLPALLGTERASRVTVWYGTDGSGLGGTLTEVNDAGVELTNHYYGVKFYPWEDIRKVDVDEPGDPSECLEYRPGPDNDCEGPVEYWQTGGSSMRAWPRCQRHGLRRLEQRERSLERYADSDLEPSWFDSADAGETWFDD